MANSELYNGIAWTPVSSLSTTRGNGFFMGTQTAAIYSAGYTGTAFSSATELWNGTAWSTFTAIDDTSTGNSDTFKFSGIVEGSGLATSTWVPVKADYSANTLLPEDPLTVQQNRIIAGGYPIVVLPPNPERYWIRFNLSAVATGGIVTFNKILPVSETYEQF